MSEPADQTMIKITSLAAAERLLDDWIAACAERDRRIEADAYRMADLRRRLELAEYRAAQFEADCAQSGAGGESAWRKRLESLKSQPERS